MGIEASFKQEAVTGIEWNGLSTLLTSAFQILQVSILSNFLSPTAFGIMAMAMVVIGFAQAFNDIGVSNAIIQRQDTTIEKLSSLYWLQIGLGCILFIFMLLITPMTVRFFSEPALTGVMMLTSLTFLVAPVGQIFQILMQKELEFKKLALIDISVFAGQPDRGSDHGISGLWGHGAGLGTAGFLWAAEYTVLYCRMEAVEDQASLSTLGP